MVGSVAIAEKIVQIPLEQIANSVSFHGANRLFTTTKDLHLDYASKYQIACVIRLLQTVIAGIVLITLPNASDLKEITVFISVIIHRAWRA